MDICNVDISVFGAGEEGVFIHVKIAREISVVISGF